MGWNWMLHGAWMAVLLAVVTAEDASAEWVRAGGTHKYDGYVDMATIGPSEHSVTLWTLRDFKVTRQVAKGPYRSMKTKKQFDCLAQRSRQLFVKYYAEQMGRGRLVYSGKGTKQWAKVTPGSDSAIEWTIACHKPDAGSPAAH